MKIKRSQLRNLISEAMNSNADEAKQLNEMWMTHGNAFGRMKSLAEAPLEPYMDDPDNLHVHPDDVRMMDSWEMRNATLEDLGLEIEQLVEQAAKVKGLVSKLAGEHGELSAIPTAATKVVNDVADVSARFKEAVESISKGY
tara:strand:+ start:158 stop:583 length:426 start_codon:yes stop_codon:yes gene_type:complete